MKLRDFKDADYETVFSIRQDPTLLDMLMSYPTPTAQKRADVEAWLNGKLADPTVTLFSIADDIGRSVGYLQVSGRHLKGKFAWFGLALASDSQGKGYGRSAMLALIELAVSQMELRKLLCEVRVDNHRAIALYSSLGFGKVGTLHNHYCDLTGTWQDVFIFERFPL